MTAVIGGVLAVGVLTLAAAPATGVPDPLPAGWHADFGVPVAWNDTYLWFFADAFTDMGADMQPTGHSMITRNALSVDGEMLVDLLPSTADGTNYWITDATELPDGSLLVMALEERDRFDWEPPFNFELIDTDAFIVRQPDDPVSWRWATKVDDGPWGNDLTYFSDQWPLVFTKDPYTDITFAWQFDPESPLEGWLRVPTGLPPSDGAFVPVQSYNGWWGVTWRAWHTVEFWRADSLDGVWTLDHAEPTVARTHDHQLNVVDGVIWHRFNNLDGTRRPEYVRVTS